MKQKRARSGSAVKTILPSAVRGKRNPSNFPKAEGRLKIPSILFEGDEAPTPRLPERETPKFATAEPISEGIEVERTELPRSYGTHKLLLLVRDPHWIYSHWDLTLPELQQYNALSADKHLVLKVRENRTPEAPVQEIHVNPESSSWFVHVDRAETEYVAELGYYRDDQSWVPVTVSEPVVMPAETESQDRNVQFATMPPAPRLEGELLSEGQMLVSSRYALVQGELFQDARSASAASAPLLFESPGLLGEWTAEQEEKLAREVAQYSVRREQAGSIELLDLIGGPCSLEAISSQMAAQPAEKQFWLEVNAELLVYGSTKPDACLTLDGQPLSLNPDGTFSFRISLPDGEYEMLIEGVSVEGNSRQARLKFTRRTEWR